MVPRIFASSVHGSDLDRWGAWGFTDRGTRDKLGAVIGLDDYVLSIGTGSAPTPDHERGRLIALMKIGSTPIETREMVEPAFWTENVLKNGTERWTHGFPIKSAERFDGVPLPSRSAILPRIDNDNLYRVVARHFIELSPDEVTRVLALPRTADLDIYASPVSAFASRLLRNRNGPPPLTGTRILSAASGPAATYVMKLTGSLAIDAARPIQRATPAAVFKIGFSNDPERRLRQLNAYLPCDETLCWSKVLTQWHEDEINAWAMEQAMFRLVDEGAAYRFKEVARFI